MNASSAPVGSSGEKAGARGWLWALLAALVCLAAVTRQSLWIDEALTAAKASAFDLPAWWQAMQADKASDLQMPLYMIYIWGFAKLFGTSEWALRMANLPWFVAGMAAFIGTIGGRAKTTLALVALLSPFAWYYLDEARPYTMQLGAALIIFAALFRLKQNENLTPGAEQRWVAAFFFGVVVLCGSSLLGMIWVGAAALSLPALFSRRRLADLWRAHELIAATLVAALAAAGVYYLWTIKLGARASDVGRTDARNVAFIAYELFGFSGLGPGRLEIRDGGLNAFKPFLVPLILYGVVVGDAAILGVRQLWRRVPRQTLFGLALAIAAPSVAILTAGFVMHFRVLGRHLTPLMAVVLVVLWLGLDAQWSRRRGLAKILGAGLVVLSLASCLSIRLAARHRKDDYRDAARVANAALRAGETVWWNAGQEGAAYYHVPLAEVPSGKNRALWVVNPTADILARLPPADVIIASRPDVFDGRGAFAEYLRQGRYLKLNTLPAFTVWHKPGEMAQSLAHPDAANLIE